MQRHDDDRSERRRVRRYRRVRLQRILQIVAPIVGGLLHLAAAILSAAAH